MAFMKSRASGAGAEHPTGFARRGGTISFPLNIAKVLSRADERPASTTANPPQSVCDLHRPLPCAIRFASAPVVAGALCRQGTTAE